MLPNHSDNISNTNRNQQCQNYILRAISNKHKFDSDIFHLAEVFPSILDMDFKSFF